MIYGVQERGWGRGPIRRGYGGEAPIAINLTQVHKRFGATRSLDGLSLRVESGAVFGFLGPNGAGKTTTLRVLLGLVRADAGSVSVLGLDPAREAPAIRAAVGVLLEADGLYDRLSALDNLDFHARVHRLDGAARAARVEELLGAFGLFERRREAVVSWSKGMRQKLAIARALLHRPRLLVLDEPFTGLDPSSAIELRERLRALARESRVTVFLTTHDLAHVERTCDDVAILREGRVLAQGPLPALLGAQVGVDVELEVEVRGEGLSPELLEGMRAAGLVVSFRLDGGAARLVCAPGARSRIGVELVARGVMLEELRTVRGSLEEVFVSLTAGDGARAHA